METNGPIIIPNVDGNLSEAVAVGVGATVYSKAFRLVDLNEFALEYKIACTGTPDLQMQLQQSSDGVNWYIPDTLADIHAGVTDKLQHGVQLSPITVGYLRIKLIEATTTVSDTVVTLKLSCQRKYGI